MSLTEPIVWLIEAGAGFGKTVLLDQLSAESPGAIVTRRPIGSGELADFTVELSGACRRAGLTEIEAAIVGAEADPIAIAKALASAGHPIMIDDVDSWNDAVSQMLAAVLRDLVGRVPCVVAARHLPPPLDRLGSTTGCRSLDANDLAFTADETQELFASSGSADAGLAFEATQGWPLAVAAVATSAGRNDSLAFEPPVNHESVIDRLLRSYLEHLSESDLDAAKSLATLPFFDDTAHSNSRCPPSNNRPTGPEIPNFCN